MTSVSDIISQAYRESNTLTIGYSPTANETAEALKRLQVIAKSVLGTKAGEQLAALSIGNNNVSSPADWVSDAPNPLPSNVRLICNLESTTTLYMPPDPQPGARVEVIDASGNFATYNLTLNGNGRKVDGATTDVLATNSQAICYFYRDDLADWKVISSFATSDDFPFPEDFDDYFIGKLALRIAPRNSHKVSEETILAMTEAEEALRARYTQVIPTRADLGVLNLTNSRSTGNINTGF